MKRVVLPALLGYLGTVEAINIKHEDWGEGNGSNNLLGFFGGFFRNFMPQSDDQENYWGNDFGDEGEYEETNDQKEKDAENQLKGDQERFQQTERNYENEKSQLDEEEKKLKEDIPNLKEKIA